MAEHKSNNQAKIASQTLNNAVILTVIINVLLIGRTNILGGGTIN